MLELRARQKRNFLATLFFSQGIPMLLAGDELGRTQGGNNNAYCQDNEISWVDWDGRDQDLLEFVKYVSQLRRENPVFRHSQFLQGNGAESAQFAWLTPTGEEMTEADWQDDRALAMAVVLNGGAITELSSHGQHISSGPFLLLFNAHSESVLFTLPGKQFGNSWQIVLSTAEDSIATKKTLIGASKHVTVTARSLLVLRRV